MVIRVPPFRQPPPASGALMAWVRLTPDRAMNRKLRKAGFAARGLDEAAICQSLADMSDGHVSRDTVEMLAIAHGEKRWERLVDLLVTVGRWTVNGDGWHIHDWLEFNWSQEKLQIEIAHKKEAGRKGGMAKAKADAIARATAPATAPATADGMAEARAPAVANAVANSTQLNSPIGFTETHDPGNPAEKPDQIPDDGQIPPHPDPAIQALIDRWMHVVARPNARSQAEAHLWIPHLASILDAKILDELIGRAGADSDSPPERIKYLAVTCRAWARDNLPGVTIPDPPAGMP
jgi:hypothetical protein